MQQLNRGSSPDTNIFIKSCLQNGVGRCCREYFKKAKSGEIGDSILVVKVRDELGKFLTKLRIVAAYFNECNQKKLDPRSRLEAIKTTNKSRLNYFEKRITKLTNIIEEIINYKKDPKKTVNEISKQIKQTQEVYYNPKIEHCVYISNELSEEYINKITEELRKKCGIENTSDLQVIAEICNYLVNKETNYVIQLITEDKGDFTDNSICITKWNNRIKVSSCSDFIR